MRATVQVLQAHVEAARKMCVDIDLWILSAGYMLVLGVENKRRERCVTCNKGTQS